MPQVGDAGRPGPVGLLKRDREPAPSVRGAVLELAAGHSIGGNVLLVENREGGGGLDGGVDDPVRGAADRHHHRPFVSRRSRRGAVDRERCGLFGFTHVEDELPVGRVVDAQARKSALGGIGVARREVPQHPDPLGVPAGDHWIAGVQRVEQAGGAGGAQLLTGVGHPGAKVDIRALPEAILVGEASVGEPPSCFEVLEAAAPLGVRGPVCRREGETDEVGAGAGAGGVGEQVEQPDDLEALEIQVVESVGFADAGVDLDPPLPGRGSQSPPWAGEEVEDVAESQLG